MIDQQLQRMAEAERRPGESTAQAYRRVLDSPEGSRLYREYIGGVTKAAQPMAAPSAQELCWAKIQQEAKQLLDSPGHPEITTMERAVAAYLKTPRGALDYQKYLDTKPRQ